MTKIDFSRWMAGSLLFMALVSCKASSYQAPEFRRIQSMQVTAFDFSHPTVTAYVVYYNPNNIGFDFRGGEMDVHVDSLWLGHTEVDTFIHVSANSEFTIAIPLQLDLQRLLQHGFQSYLGKKVDLKVDGIVRGSKAGIQKKFPIHYEGEQDLNLKLF
jgi:LEA14-like dessication related protein